MADIKISELTAVSSLNNGDLVEVSQVNELAPSGYTSLKASMADIGKKVNTDIEYTTDLADFTDKTTLGAIKETAKGKNIADEYDDTQTYNKGDVVIYKNTLYICTTNNTTGAWDATKWTATTVQSLIGTLSSLTTTNKDSLVDALNEVNGYKSGDTITLTNYFAPCVYDASRLRASINLPKLVRNCTFSCSFLEVYINSTDSVQTSNITNTEVQTRTPNQLWVQFTGNFTNVSNNNAGIAVISGTITFT